METVKRKTERRNFIDKVRAKGFNPFAHTRTVNGTQSPEDSWELLPEHTNMVANYAKNFASVLGWDFIAEVIARLHDIGKYDPRFYQRVKGWIESYDHAALGGRISDIASRGFFAQIILGHHRYIPDNIEENQKGANDRIEKAGHFSCDSEAIPSETEIEKAYQLVMKAILEALNLSFDDDATKNRFKSIFLFGAKKFLYSCLVDADYLGTENFYEGKRRKKRHEELPQILDRFLAYHEKFVSKNKSNAQPWLTDMRNDIWDSAIGCGETDGTAYTLTGPTGSGKTFAYIAMALKKAIREKKNRIIIVLPFCSIITQVCETLRKAVGEKNVLEHHSGYDLYEQIVRSSRYKQFVKSSRYKQFSCKRPGWKKRKAMRRDIESLIRQSCENWDAPIVVTTREQFDESFFCRYPGRSRRIHNMANSVIVFDEVQTTPRGLTIPFMGELHILRNMYKSILILSTATQPSYSRKPERLWGLSNVQEVVIKAKEYYRKASERVVMKQLGDILTAELVDKIQKHDQVMVVLNTRQNAFIVSDMLKSRGIPHLHLSTLMHKRRVRAVINEVKRRLSGGKKVILITTQIVEAGVDLDFPVGYSENCPLDSRLQRAGRVNRNGKIGHPCDFFLFNLSDGNKNTGYGIANSITESTLYYSGDAEVNNLETVDTFYDYFLFENGDNLDKKGIVPIRQNAASGLGGCESCISTVDKKSVVVRTKFSLYDEFKYIANRMSIAIPVDKRSQKAIEEVQDAILKGRRPGRRLLTILQDYMVSVYENEFDELNATVDLEESFGFHILRDMSWYSRNHGLDVWHLPCHMK